MTELMLKTLRADYVDIVYLFILIVAVVTVLFLMYDIIFALRAKRRAFDIIQTASHEVHVFRLARSAGGSDFGVSIAKVEELKIEIERHLIDMSERDRKFVHQGLYQSSDIGAVRYIRDVLGRRVTDAA